MWVPGCVEINMSESCMKLSCWNTQLMVPLRSSNLFFQCYQTIIIKATRKGKSVRMKRIVQIQTYVGKDADGANMKSLL